MGRPLSEDGDFGINTFNSVIKFQEDNGLFPDGVVGDKTRKAISDKKREKDNETKEPSSENFSQSIYEDALYNSFPKEVKLPYPSKNTTRLSGEQPEFNYADEVLSFTLLDLSQVDTTELLGYNASKIYYYAGSADFYMNTGWSAGPENVDQVSLFYTNSRGRGFYDMLDNDKAEELFGVRMISFDYEIRK